jgi:hypothetical protein
MTVAHDKIADLFTETCRLSVDGQRREIDAMVVNEAEPRP